MPEQISARKVAIWTATVILVILGFEFLWLIRDVLFLIFLSILLATGIEPAVKWLRRGPFNRGTGILIVYSFIIGILALIAYLTIPPIIEEGRNLISGFTNPQTAQDSINKIDNGFFRGLASSAYQSASSIIQNFKPDAETLNLGLTFVGTVFSAITVFVIAFYWLTERATVKRFLFSFASDSKRPQIRLTWDSVEEKLGAWVRGQLTLMLFVGVLAGVGYTVFGVKYSLALGAFAALAEVIPLVGPYIGGAPAVLIALTQSSTLALVVIVYIIIVQLVEGNVLVPRIMEKAVGVSPLTVIIGILIGSTLMGIGGALLAVPVTAAIQVIFNNVLSFGSEATPYDQAVAGSIDSSKAMSIAASTRKRLKWKRAKHSSPEQAESPPSENI
jgi:predicted PurR-regulated permease PerM